MKKVFGSRFGFIHEAIIYFGMVCVGYWLIVLFTSTASWLLKAIAVALFLFLLV